MKLYSVLSKILGIFYIFLGVVSVISGIMVSATNGIGMPISWLENTLFDSYMIPGLILCVIIGGLSLLSAILLLMKKPLAVESSVALEFALLIWIYTEIYLIRQSLAANFIFRHRYSNFDFVDVSF